MERLKAMVAPREFTTIKVTKSTLDFIRFEGEVANKPVMEDIISRIDAKHMKLSGFSEPFKIKCGPAKSNYPTKVSLKNVLTPQAQSFFPFHTLIFVYSRSLK